MSIIHDALKKVQKNLENTPPSEFPMHTPSTAKDTPTIVGEAVIAAQSLPALRATKKTNPWLIIILALLVTGISSFFIFQQFKAYSPALREWLTVLSFKAKRAAIVAPQAIAVPQHQAQPLAQVTLNTNKSTAAPAPVAAKPITLNVHGVMADGTKNLALINDKIYQEGDTIEGVTITKISMDELHVLNNGKEEIIPVRK